MKAHFELKKILKEFHNISDEFIKSIAGAYLFNDYSLYIDYAQEDEGKCYKFRIKVDQSIAGFPKDTYSNRSREIALRDFITRCFHNCVLDFSCEEQILINKPGQEILERTTVFVDSNDIEIRFKVNLEAFFADNDREELEELIFTTFPEIVSSSLIYENLDIKKLKKHIETVEDADFLRNELENLRLIAFVAEDSILKCRNGKNLLPQSTEQMTPFSSPEILKMDVELPNRGQITGMGLPRGITVITGKEASGKSALLNAIQMGIYNHIPGDGREFVVSNPNSVKIKSEEGRMINNVDISAFVESKEAAAYSTSNADQFQSQAANVIEALEIGADVLLFDENSSAPEFLFPGRSNSESITSFAQKAKPIFLEYMVSSIIAVENPNDFLSSADFVVEISDYKPQDITSKVKDSNTEADNLKNFGYFRERIPDFKSTENKNLKIDINSIDLRKIDQIVSTSQTNAISKAIEYSKKYMDGKKTIRQVASLVMLDIGRIGLDILDNSKPGSYAEFRKIEMAAIMNRIDSIKFSQK